MPSIAISGQGSAVIAHQGVASPDGITFTDAGFLTLCYDRSCPVSDVVQVAGFAENGDGEIGPSPSVVRTTTGILAAFHDTTAGDLVVVHCSANDRSDPVTTTIVTPEVDGATPSIAVGPNGLPVIVHQDDADQQLMLTLCSTVDCSTSTTRVLDGGQALRNGVFLVDVVGLDPSIAFGPNGFPTIAHGNETLGTIEVFGCNNADCTSAGTYQDDFAGVGG